MLNSQEKLDTIRTYWQAFLQCSDEHFDQKKISVFPHAKDGLEPIEDENEIYVLEWKGGGTVVSVSSRMFERVSTILQKTSADVEGEIGTEIDIVKKHGPQLAYYQFDSPIFSISPNVRQLVGVDVFAYETFMNACDPKDWKMVCMDFENPFHTFFAYIDEGRIFSLGNYIRYDNEDMIAHIGIITLPEAQGKGYATQVIQSLLNDTSAKGFIPQWRAHGENHISQKMAEDFGFTEILRTYSLIAG